MAERGLSVGIKAPPVGVGCRHTAPPDRGSPLDLHKRESQLCMLAPDGTATEHDSIALLWQLPAYVRQLLVRVLWATGRAARISRMWNGALAGEYAPAAHALGGP